MFIAGIGSSIRPPPCPSVLQVNNNGCLHLKEHMALLRRAMPRLSCYKHYLPNGGQKSEWPNSRPHFSEAFGTLVLFLTSNIGLGATQLDTIYRHQLM